MWSLKFYLVLRFNLNWFLFPKKKNIFIISFLWEKKVFLFESLWDEIGELKWKGKKFSFLKGIYVKLDSFKSICIEFNFFLNQV